jgi:flagella basal body P-ring formation protein FlgA
MRIPIAAAVCLWVAAGGAADAQDRLILAADCVVAGWDARLADLGEIQGPGREAWAGILVAPVPPPREEALVTREQILGVLAAAGRPTGALVIEGAPAVRLRAAWFRVRGETLEEAGRAFLSQAFGPSATVSAECTAGPGADLRRGREGNSLRVDWASQLRTGDVGLDASLTADGREAAKVRVTFSVRVAAFVLIPRREIKPGEWLDEKDVVRERIDLAEPRKDLADNLGSLAGAQATAPLVPGKPLRRTDLIYPVCVRAGDPVRVRVCRGGLVVSAGGVALGQGRVGDVISVTIPAAARTVRAAITGPGRLDAREP